MIVVICNFSRSKREDIGECTKCCMRGCICCFFCLEKFVRYLNHNAYTVIAIDGVNFCTAAKTVSDLLNCWNCVKYSYYIWQAFEVLVAHSLQVATINSVGDFILFLGKCFVTAATGSVGLFIFRRNPILTFYAAPTLLVCVFSFFIAHCILSLYEVCISRIFVGISELKKVWGWLNETKNFGLIGKVRYVFPKKIVGYQIYAKMVQKVNLIFFRNLWYGTFLERKKSYKMTLF